MTLRELAHELNGKYGQGTVADKIGVDPAAYSRFLSGENGLKLDKVQALLDLAGVCVIQKQDLEDLEMALATVTKMWERERRE